MPGIYRREPYPDEMDQARDELIRRDEYAAPQAPAVTGNASPSIPLGLKQPAVAAALNDELLGQFTELMLRVNAARIVY